jgi:hypothetical protein
MRKQHPELTQERLRGLLSYNEASGLFYWLVSRQGHAKASDRAGSIGASTGYEYIMVDGRKYSSHRLAWLYVHGRWPAHEIDHIDGDRLNNAIANLRDVTRGINHQNRRAPRSDSKIGLIGVCRNGKRYAARIQVGGKHHCIGTFDAPEEAHRAYVEAKRRLHVGGML